MTTAPGGKASTHRATVCISTHKRPEGLKRLLTSLTEQVNAPDFDVVVVDNDHLRSAECIARTFSGALRLTYVVEPVRGLSRVRNRTVAESAGEFLAFIDDDEWASPDWLRQLDDRAVSHAADVVIGPVSIAFDQAVPDYIRTCSLFRRPRTYDGVEVPGCYAYTGNAYVRRQALPHPTTPFSERFNFTGGEDVDLFTRMIRRGARVIGAGSAGVFAHRELRRANMRWLMKRALRNGNNRAMMEWSALSLPRRLWLATRAGGRAVVEGIVAANAWPRNKSRATVHLIGMAERVGRFAAVFGVEIEEYRKHP